MQRAFDREYARLYHRVIPEAEVEVLTWALTISTVLDSRSTEQIGWNRTSIGGIVVDNDSTGEICLCIELDLVMT